MTAAPMHHDFGAQLQVGHTGEARLDAFFRAKGRTVEEASHADQLDGIDRWMKGPLGRLAVEYKTDVKSEQTHRFAIELVSQLAPQKLRPGWSYASKADFIALLQPAQERFLWLKADALRAQLFGWLGSKPLVVAVPNESYHSLCMLIPVDDVAARCGGKWVDMRGVA